MTRRTALGTIAGLAGAGAVSAGGMVVYCDRRLPEDASPAERLTMAYPDRAGPIEVGRRYLARHPEERDEARLVAAIERSLGPETTAIRCPASAGAALAARNTADFRAGRVAWIDGWMLGRTEARVCALIALGYGSG